MQIRLIPRRIGDHWHSLKWSHCLEAWRKALIIITGCGVMTSSGLAITYYSRLLDSFGVGCFIYIVQPTMKHISYSFHMGRHGGGGGGRHLMLPLEYVSALLMTHAEPCIKCRPWQLKGLVGSSGPAVHSHMKEVKWCSTAGKDEVEGNLSAVRRSMWAK